MELKFFESSIFNLIGENKLLKFCFVCMVIGQIWMGYQVRYAMHHERTILVPQHMDSKITITDGYASADYIKKFARDITNLAFNYMPGSVRGQFGELLMYYSPRVSIAAKKAFYEMADTIERTKVTSQFIITQPIDIDTVKCQMTVTGMQRLWADTNPLAPEPKSYLLEYSVFDGAFRLESISERVANANYGTGAPKAKAITDMKVDPRGVLPKQ